jgi:predicted ATPase/class 3 adenylate cyclase
LNVVRSWLESHGFGEFAELFESHRIDAEAFLLLAEHHLRDMGIPLGPRLKLLAARARAPIDASPEISAAERRRLTVMFVDLVGSTDLASRMDPEQLRGVIRTYQQIVATEVGRYGAYVAQYLGDGAMVYFGYPAAHEDDAERAIRAGLAIVRELEAMPRTDDRRETVRIGIATGLVVVGDLIGTGVAKEHAVVGETPNLAARLQALAAPGEIIVSEQTRLLTGGYFDLRSLGPQTLRGMQAPTTAFRVVGELAVQSRFAARQNSHGALIGREVELTRLEQAAREVCEGRGQFVLLHGDAGIGKSRIVHELLGSGVGANFTVLHHQCSAYHMDSALFPVLQRILRAAGIQAVDAEEVRAEKLKSLFVGAEHDDLALVAGLLGNDSAAQPGSPDRTPQQQRSRTFDALFGQLRRLTEGRPVMWVLEDAHWIDPTTLELMQRFIPEVEPLRLLVVVTSRSEFPCSAESAARIVRLELPRLDRLQAAEIVRGLTRGKLFPDDLLNDILSRADGVPLYVEELTKSMLESSAMRETDDAFIVDRAARRPAVPASLHDSLMARLDRIQPYTVVAQTAACIGREFDYQLLASVCRLPETALQEALASLQKAELIYPRSATQRRYHFKHALLRDAAYESLLLSNRRLIHARLTSVLEGDAKIAPQIIAQHAAEAGLIDKAIGNWQKAAMLAAAQPAYREAISHLTQALALADQMDDSRPWLECRLQLWVALGQVSIPFYGYGHSSTAKAFAQARELAARLGNIPQRFSIEYANWLACYVRGEHDRAIETAARMIDQSQDHQGSRLAAMRSLGISQMVTGCPLEACKTFERAQSIVEALRERSKSRGIAVADRYAADPEIATQFHVALTWWSLGRIDEAWQLVDRSLAEARAIKHAHTMGHGVAHGAIFAVVCHDAERALSLSGEAIEIAEKYDMELWRGYGLALHGFALALKGDLANSVAFMERGFASLQVSETGAMIQIHHAMHARTLARLGLFGRAREHAEAARRELRSGSERYLWPECQRLLGDYLRHCQEPNYQEVEEAYLRALHLAHQQGALSWKLYAATSLAQYWSEQARVREALELLEPVLASFSQGFESPGYHHAADLLRRIQLEAGAISTSRPNL